MRPILALCALLLVVWPMTAGARPYTVEDLLATEALGQVSIDPTGRWLVIEHQRPWNQAARYDYNYHTSTLLTELQAVDLEAPGKAKPLFEQGPDAGYMAGPIAPDGARMLVYRLRDHSFEAGIVTLASGQVRWLGITPELPVYGRAAQWRSARQLLLIARPDGDLPRQLSIGWQAGQRLVDYWADTAAGKVAARTRFGSGAFLDVRVRGETPRLLTIDAVTGAASTLAVGEFVDLEVSRTGRHVALITQLADVQPNAEDRVYSAYPTRRRGLTIVDLKTAKVSRPSLDGDLALGLLAWSPKADELLVARRRPDLAWDARELVRIDAGRGKVTRPAMTGLMPRLSYNGEGAHFPRADWLGGDPIVYAEPEAGGRADWYRLAAKGPVKLTAALRTPSRWPSAIGQHDLQMVDDGGLWRIDTLGRASRLGDARDPAPSGKVRGTRLRENPDLPGDPAPNTSPGNRAKPPLPDRAQVVAMSAQRTVILTRDPNGVRRLSIDAPDGAWRPVLEINAGLAEVTPADVVAVKHLGADGRALTSWLYLPPDRAKDARLPLVVVPYRGFVYPAPAPRFEVGEFNAYMNIQVLVGAGYGVLTPSLPYDEASGEPAPGVAAEILPIVDAALAQGGLDPDRIGLFGHSFGALGVVAAAAQTTRFKTVIGHAGVHDQFTNWGIFPFHQWLVPEDGYAPVLTAGHTEQAQSNMLAPPWNDPQRYLRNSNILAADRITAPVLLLHGELDEIRVFQSQELFSALYRQGKDAMLVTYWGEGHAFASPANIRDMYQTMLGWLARTLPSPGTAGPPRPPPSDGPRPRSSPR
ncbi:alpha/beta hydrolase family protein [Phenylobacterium sp.]|uniref:alpha/beta hydrolase family protein n=1 Tax=Phenylobacterium sp. TaxID=1871053 RepID=UPI002FC63094